MTPRNPSLRRLLSLDQPPSSRKTTIPRAPIERLPASIIHDIGRHSDLRDVLHLSLCSHRLSMVLAPILYASVELTTNRNCKNTLIALAKRPDLMQHVRRLVVRPNCVQWTDPGEEMDEGLVATLISRMAVSLRALEVFEWDGMEMAGPELWAALRLSSRNLKRIGTSIGDDPLDPSSPLWEFDDLRQFSLRVKCHSLDWISDGLAKPEKLPRRFWEMILERSPRLEDLTISSPAPSPRTFDIRHITFGRWSRLHSLTLGDHVLIASDQSNYNTKDHLALMAFFLHHPGLRTLHLEHTPGSVSFPSGFDFETSHALPNVEEFAGPIAWVRTLPVKQRLRRLRVVGMHHSYHGYGYADSNVARTCRVLAGLRWLEELSVWIDLSFGAGAVAAISVAGSGRRASFSGKKETSASEDVNMEVVTKFLVSRPGLKHLEVSCFSRPSFSIKDFSATIRRSAPTLESFTLTKVHKSGDEEERELTRLAAANIAIDNPGLRKFTLRTTVDPWFSPGFGFHVGQGAGMGGANAGGRLRQLGVYEVLESFDVLPSPFEELALDEPGLEEELGVLNPMAFQQPLHVAIQTTTALLVREWGQKPKSTTTRIIMDTLGPGSSGGKTARCYVYPLSLSDPPLSSSTSGYDSSTSPSPPPLLPNSASRSRLTQLSPPTSPTIATHFPPSSWQMHTSSVSRNKKQRSHAHSRSLSGGTSGTSPFSFSLTRSRSRSKSPSPGHPSSVGWRPRRASCSSVAAGGESLGGVWEGYSSGHGHGKAGGILSNKSSFCSTAEGPGSGSGCVTVGSSSGCGGGQISASGYRRVQLQPQPQPFVLQNPNQHPVVDPHQQVILPGRNHIPQGQVTWAQSVEEKSSLGRSGSASTAGSSGSGCASTSSTSQSVSQVQVQVQGEKRSRTKSLRLNGLRWGIGRGKGKGKEEVIEREVVIEEGYILV